jgi:integrase
MSSKWLTDAVVRDLRLPGRGTTRVFDLPHPGGKKGWVSGFGVRVSAGGSKSFVLRYRSRKTRAEHLYTIGTFPAWSVDAARAEAKDLKHRIEKGDDPQAAREAERNAATVAELCDKFVADDVVKKRPNTVRDYTGIIAKIIKPALGRKLVAALDHKDVEELHADISKRGHRHRANRVVAVLSRMMTLAIKWRLRPDNPCKGLERNPETKRKRYLTPDELGRLTRALAEYPDQHMANVFRLLLLTGARKSEILGARWEQFDLGNRQVWVKPAYTTKQKAEHEIPLGDGALALLKAMRKAAPDAEHLFPGRSSSGHLEEVKKPWAAICKRAGITGLRMHDLRHSYASMLASAGYSLPVIGALLGHTQPNTTARYAHLLDDPLREATSRVGSMMSGLVMPKRPAKPKLRAVR